MKKQRTITIEQTVYDDLAARVGPEHVDEYVERLLDKASTEELESGYAAMAADEAHEAEALEWADALIGDASDDPR